jgi:hypothetical protein
MVKAQMILVRGHNMQPQGCLKKSILLHLSPLKHPLFWFAEFESLRGFGANLKTAKSTGIHMKIKNVLFSSVLVFTAGTFLVVENVIAENAKTIAIEAFEGLSIRFTEDEAAKNSTVSISGPNGFFASSAAENGIPTINLSDFGSPSDGRYKYQITSSVGNLSPQATRQLNNGRASDARKVAHKRISQSGYFYLEDGQIKHFFTMNDLNQTTSR